MDHIQVLSKLSTADRKKLQQKKDGPAFLNLLLHCGIILILATLIHLRVPAWQVLVIPHGIVLVFLFNLQHECTHTTPFKTTWINETLGYICGLIIIQPFLWFRYFHLVHHRYTNDPKRDPEIMGITKPVNLREYLLYLSTFSYWCGKLTLLHKHAFSNIDEYYIPASIKGSIKLEACILVLIYSVAIGIMLFYTSALFWIWLLPLLVGFPFLKLYHLAEHGLCAMVENKFLNTRTVLTNRLVKIITWSMPYHTEHHLLPGVPFHQLPVLHEAIKNNLKVSSRSYAEFSTEYLKYVVTRSKS